MPQGGGTFEIPPAPFVYFDPTDGRYKTLQTDPVEVAVSGDPLAEAAAPTDPNGPAALIASADWRRPPNGPLLWGLLGGGLALPLVAAGLFFGARVGREKLTADTPRKQRRRTRASAHRRLAEARGLSGPAAFAEADRAVRAALAVRLGVPTGALGADELDAEMTRADVPPAARASVREVLAACAVGRYAPGLADDAGPVVAQAQAVVSELGGSPRRRLFSRRASS